MAVLPKEKSFDCDFGMAGAGWADIKDVT